MRESLVDTLVFVEGVLCVIRQIVQQVLRVTFSELRVAGDST